MRLRTNVDAIYRPILTTRWVRPLILTRVPAGFPSPAEDYIEGRLDLNRHLIKHPVATFFIRVSGDSMEPRIHPGDLLVVDRAQETTDEQVVVARIYDELCIKRLRLIEGKVWLYSDNTAYQPIEITEEMDFEVWGRVMYSIQAH